MIRKLTSSDHSHFRDFRLLGLELNPVAFATMASTWRNASPEMTISALKDSESESSSVVLGSFDGDTLVGMVGLKRDGRESVGHKATLWGLFVAPESQRKGIGKALLDEAIKEARNLGLRYLRLITRDFE